MIQSPVQWRRRELYPNNTLLSIWYVAGTPCACHDARPRRQRNRFKPRLVRPGGSKASTSLARSLPWAIRSTAILLQAVRFANNLDAQFGRAVLQSVSGVAAWFLSARKHFPKSLPPMTPPVVSRKWADVVYPGAAASVGVSLRRLRL